MVIDLPKRRKLAAIQDYEEPHFFTVIVSPATQLHKLRIPNKFINEHGKRMPDSVLLHVPDGENHTVKLLKSKGDVYLNEGWNQFAANYSIQAGCFLVFRFYGRSKFLVLIFDAKSALEILHQIPKQNGEFESPNEDEHGKREEAASPTNSPLQRAKAFESAKPNFIIHIRKRNLSYNSGPGLPADHYRTYFKDNYGNRIIILRVNNKPYILKYRIEKMHKFCISLASGWKEFAVKNKLQEGDVCVFEMIRSHPKTYDVHLFPVSDDEEIKDDIPTGTSRGKGVKRRVFPRAQMEKAEAFVSTSPGFIIAMGKSYVRSSRLVRVPLSHSKQYLKNEGGDLNAIVINGEGGKAWKVKYGVNEVPELGCGWSKFRSDNGLEIGDVCAFKLVNEAKKTYNLAIFRGNAEEDTDLKNKAKAYLGESPGFIKCMTKSNVNSAHPLPVPISHSERYMKANENADLNAIVIKGKGGKTSKIKYRLDESYPKLGVGWTRFRSDNCLEIGDVCAFKLINTSQKVYEVAIFRVNDK